MMLKRYITLLAIIISLPAWSQVRINFVPEIYGRNVNGLFNCQIMNAQQSLTGSLIITVSERNSGTLCIIKTPDFNLLPGSNPIPLQAARQSSIQFSNNRSGKLLSLNNSFPAGDYDYCYILTLKNSDGIPDEQCFSYVLAPFAELNLIDPYDQDKICNKRPLFTWQPLVPAVPGSYYQLVLTEIKTGQSATEAINYNLPLINQRNIISPVLPFPSVVRELELNKKYSWQVTAYKDRTILNRSEVWEFTVNCIDSIKKPVLADGYRDIEDLSKGNFYVANGYLRFGLVNPYNIQDLKYTIQSMSNPEKKIKRLPRVKLQNGLNEIDIDLSANSSFNDGEFYILTVSLPNGGAKNLRFLYQEEQ